MSIALGLLVGTAAWAQKTTFNPSLQLGWGYTDNVAYVGEGVTAPSDSNITFGLTLPLRQRGRNSDLQLRYDLDAYRYQDSSALDDTNHRLTFDLGWASRRDARWSFRTSLVDTTQQAGAPILPVALEAGVGQEPVDDADLSVTQRVQRRTLTTSIGHSWRVGKLWALNAGIAASTTAVESIVDLAGGVVPTTAVEDRDSYGFDFGVARDLSRRTKFGFRYSYQLAELETSGDEDFQQLAVRLDHDISRRLFLRAEIGGVQRTADASDEDETEFTGSLVLGFNDGLIAGPVRIDFGFDVSPSPGGVLQGTSLNSSANVGFSGVRTEPLNWRADLRYTRRDPFDNTLFVTETGYAGVTVQSRIGKRLALRFGTNWTDQSSDDPAGDVSLWRADASLVWYPLSGTRIAGQ